MNLLVVIEPSGIETISRFEYSEPALEDLQAAVGGYIELVRVRYKGKIRYAYVNEDGRRLDLPLNPFATSMASEFGYGPIVGTIAINVPMRNLVRRL